MKFQLFVIALVALTGVPAMSAQEADPRAIQLCKTPDTAFTKIADCIAGAHVAFKTLDAFDATYSTEAQPLKLKCIELNKDSISGAESCVLDAIKTAVQLKAALPADENLGDPIFDAVSDQDKYTKVREVASKARQESPYKGGMKSGSTYFPYK